MFSKILLQKISNLHKREEYKEPKTQLQPLSIFYQLHEPLLLSLKALLETENDQIIFWH